ncbi:hypothetical protein C2G38_2157560 [Gigaspora rosea]|uniref:Uncharacterized protein n=1 Tax=Gigaspora rosea TaxID=44941 RepID=A0A397W1H1_9GLOM|nr:hypothetical protein C2G38_2157560 [Gigaspora rosea]
MEAQQSVEAGEVHDAYQEPNTQKRWKQNTNDITSEPLNTTTQENSKSCESTSAMIVEQNSRSGLTRKFQEGITLEPTHTEQTLDMEIDETPTNIPSKERSEQNIPQRLYSDAAKKAKSTGS